MWISKTIRCGIRCGFRKPNLEFQRTNLNLKFQNKNFNKIKTIFKNCVYKNHAKKLKIKNQPSQQNCVLNKLLETFYM